MIDIVILGAGSSSRMGTQDSKLLTLVNGRPLIEWTVSICNLLAPRLDLLLVVAPESSAALAAFAESAGMTQIVAARAADGISHSIRAGLEAALARENDALLLLGDDPLCALALPDVITGAESSRRAQLVWVDRTPAVPHPVYIPRGLIAAVLDEMDDGDDGLRAVLQGVRPDLVLRVQTGAPAPIDIDSPADVQALSGALSTVKLI